MVVYFFILVAVVCSGISVAGKNEFFKDYCSQKNTSTVNGIFSVLIFLSHGASYLKLDEVVDAPYLGVNSFLGQLVVVTYLFYSGYGIMESIKKKGLTYVKGMPVNRLFKLWYHFALAVCLYIVTRILVNGKLDLKNTLLAFTGYTSVGNSNWYMFVTFIMHIIVIISFLAFKKSQKLALITTFVLSVAFLYGEYKIGLPNRFFNTAICFPIGMIFSVVKPKIDKLLMKNDVIWCIVAVALAGGITVFSHIRDNLIIYYELLSVFFAMFITVLLMKVSVKSTVLDWFGSHIFSFFILQRISMILLSKLAPDCSTLVFIGCSFICTVAAATVFDAVTEKLDGLIFRHR